MSGQRLTQQRATVAIDLPRVAIPENPITFGLSFFLWIMSVQRYSCFCTVNNHGASLVQDGCYKQAISVLATGLKLVREEMAMRASLSLNPSIICSCIKEQQTLDSRMSGDNCISLESQQDSSSEHCVETQRNTGNNASQYILDIPGAVVAEDMVGHSPSCQETITKTQKDRTYCEDVEKEPFLFSLPLFLQASGNTSLTTTSCMMIFNMALSYDLISKFGRGDPIQDNGRKTALKLYELAFRVQDGDVHSEIPLLYLCGLLNNMARLYTHFQNRDGASWCLSYLLGILMYYKMESQYHGRKGRGANQIEPYFLSQFFRSTSVMVLKDPGTAEAA